MNDERDSDECTTNEYANEESNDCEYVLPNAYMNEYIPQTNVQNTTVITEEINIESDNSLANDERSELIQSLNADNEDTHSKTDQIENSRKHRSFNVLLLLCIMYYYYVF
jgi:hypothetical protein